MLLTIDIGNSNVVWGLFRQQTLIGHWRSDTDPARTAGDYGNLLAHHLRNVGRSAEAINDAILCSVVPALLPAFEQMAKDLSHRKPLVVSSDMDTGLTLHYADPRELGADRLVNAAAAYDRYKTSLIVVDLGTATTFSVITGRGDFLGGAIAPGLGIGAEVLSARTAQLPKVTLLQPKTVIGRDTVSSIQSGLIYGHASMVDDLIARLQDESGQQSLVVATGGFSSLLAPCSRKIQEVRPYLTLEGLELLHRRTRGQTKT
ncbi:MAG: type III pantothenate kinase [Nitrospirae bacterium]|nr:MAG: type III pantothenate kinase [Nitrospirota bacterium]